MLLFRRYYDNCTRNPIAHNALSLRWLSSSSVRFSPNEHSFTVSYLIKSLGFSLEVSKTISKRVSFETSHKPDKAIEFLRNFGFSQTQIPKLVRSFPQVLILNTEKRVLPKLEFLESKGISRPDLVKSLSFYPKVLSGSLDKSIIPNFEYLRALLPSEAKIAMIIKLHPNILTKDNVKFVSPNVSALRRMGVPDSNISKFVNFWPMSLSLNSVRFQKVVEEVYEMGFNPSRINFIIAVSAKAGKENWIRKFNMYKKWGWSDKDILKAFRSDPWCMKISEDRFTSLMDFFVLQMGLKPCDLAKCPMVFNYNLKNRVIPRVMVFGALVSKGLMKKRVKLYTLLHAMEKEFLQRYVNPYANIAPELLKLYEEGNENGTFEWIRDLGEISELI